MLRTKQGIDSYWMNEPLQTGFTQSHNIFAEGGDAAFRYGIGMTYTQTQGVMKNSNRDVLNGNVQLTYRIDKFAFTNQTNITNTDVENPTVSFSDFARTNPFYDKYNEYGEIDQVIEEIQTISGGTQYITNPLWDLNQKSYDKNNQLSFTNNFQIEYRPLPELRIRGKLGIIVGRSNSKQFDSPEMSKYLTTDQLKRGSYSESNTKSSSYDGSLDISYGKTFGKHTVTPLVVCRLVKTIPICLCSRQSATPATCSQTRTSPMVIPKVEDRALQFQNREQPATMLTSTMVIS